MKPEEQVREVCAAQQVELPPEQVLQSTNAGVVVDVAVPLKQSCNVEGRQALRALASYLNRKHAGVATVLLFDEVFGEEGRVHCLVHARTLSDHEALKSSIRKDEELRSIMARQGGANGSVWYDMFVDRGITQTTMLPQFRGMYGAKLAAATQEDSARTELREGKALRQLPGARFQTDIPDEELLHSGNAGLMIHRCAQLRYEFRSEGRQFAREVVDSINSKARGEATCFLYEEAFGPADQIHWLIHLRDFSSYYPLIKMHAVDDEVRELYYRQTIPEEKGGGNWSRMFIQGSMKDTAFAPQEF